MLIMGISYEDRLATVHEASQEAHNIVSRLSVKTRGRLVQEKQSRLSHELNAQCHTLPLFDGQTGSRHCCNVRISLYSERRLDTHPLSAHQRCRAALVDQ